MLLSLVVTTSTTPFLNFQGFNKLGLVVNILGLLDSTAGVTR